MSVFHGLFEGKTWQPAIMGAPDAALAVGLGEGDGEGPLERDGVGLVPGVGLAPSGFGPPGAFNAPPPPLHAATKIKVPLSAKVANHFML